MPTKAVRHATILQLVRERSIGSQYELAQELRRTGIRVSQGTLSRDLKELGLAKARSGYRAVSGETAPLGGESTLRRIAREFLISSDRAANLIILKTPPGSASTLAEALDETGWREMLGTLAGDDTILCIARSTADGRRLLQRLRRLLV